MEEIIITVDATGKTKVEVNGCAGSSCKDLTREIERALGESGKETLKGEFYEKGPTVRAVNKR